VKTGDTFWLTILIEVQLVFILIAVIMFMRVPGIGRKDYLGLGLMMWLSLLTEIITSVGAEVFHTNMNLVINTFQLIYLPLGLWFYQRRIEGLTTIAVIGIITIYVSLGLINLFFFQGITSLNSYTSTLLHIGFMCLSVAYFAALFFQHNEYLTTRGMFWINAAILIYSSGAFFIHLLIDYLVRFLNNDLIIIWMVHHSLGLIYYGFISYGLIKVRREYLSHIISI
jgi:hypothetical protein